MLLYIILTPGTYPVVVLINNRTFFIMSFCGLTAESIDTAIVCLRQGYGIRESQGDTHLRQGLSGQEVQGDMCWKVNWNDYTNTLVATFSNPLKNKDSRVVYIILHNARRVVYQKAKAVSLLKVTTGVTNGICANFASFSHALILHNSIFLSNAYNSKPETGGDFVSRIGSGKVLYYQQLITCPK